MSKHSSGRSSETSAESSESVLPPHLQVMQTAGSLVTARALYALAELGVADYLEDGPRSVEELARKTGAHAPSLYRLLRTMAAYGFFVEGERRSFSLTPLGAALRSGAPSSARSTVLTTAGQTYWQAFSEFLHSVRTGEPGAEKVLGKSFFEHLSEAPEEAHLFNEAMAGIYGGEPPAIAEAYDFSGIERIVDVGGGGGSLLTTILLANSQMRGVLYDRSHVVQESRTLVEAEGLGERCDAVEGDFLESVPAGGDAYLLSHVLHDWAEPECLTILSNCRRAMDGRGRLLVVEMVVPPGAEPHPAKHIDLVMLAVTGGRERDEEEYAELLGKADFELRQVVPTALPSSVIEARPA